MGKGPTGYSISELSDSGSEVAGEPWRETLATRRFPSWNANRETPDREPHHTPLAPARPRIGDADYNPQHFPLPTHVKIRLMQTLNIAELRKERDALTKRLAALDHLLEAVDSFDVAGNKKPGRPKGTQRKLSAKARRNIALGQKKRREAEAAAKKKAEKSA